MQKLIAASIAGLLVALGASSAVAAAPDWGGVAGRDITVFYPGVSPMEWITKGTEHGGARGLRKGESCAGCHDEETADMGQKMVTGQKLEPRPIKGKAGSIPVNVKAAHDGTNLYLRFSWKEPEGGDAEEMDPENEVKLSVMLEDNKIAGSNLSGCWEACHQDVRTMPGAKDDKKTKYVPGGNVTAGVYYDLIQWTSKGARHDGYVADKRVMDGGTALLAAKGEERDDEWVVVFTRKLKGSSAGDISLVPGKAYNLGFAIHDDHTRGRFHHVSLGYSLGINTAGDITAVRK
ncbi:MAG: ethylbenzene dehydrogenase-related protein [Gammaproteobacteria bacterium]|nr:ethylbenzene dehydrogenase-related protein [Gammaproteobacteria bacterium]